MVGLWVLPKTTGPHLLAGPFTAPFKAQLLALILAGAIIAPLVFTDSTVQAFGPWIDFDPELPSPAFPIHQRIRIACASARYTPASSWRCEK